MIEAGERAPRPPDQTREGETQVIREKGEERRKEREEWRDAWGKRLPFDRK